MGKHRSQLPCRACDAYLVLHRSGCRCTHVRRAERRISAASKGDDVGHIRQWHNGHRYDYNLLVSWPEFDILELG